MKKLAIAPMFFGLLISLFQVHAGKQQQVQAKKQRPVLNMLYSTEQVFDDAILIKDVTSGFFKDGLFFYVLNANRQIRVYDSRHKLLHIFPSFMQSPTSVVIDSERRIYIADPNANQIKVFTPKGEAIKTISISQPISFAVLSNGNIIVASPSNGWLLHLYSPSGQELRSFGRIKQFDPHSKAQNNFLNRGKVLVDSSDTIYYAYKYAPIPIVQKYSPKGKELSEFTITGSAIDLQLEPSQEFLKNRAANKIGGISIINSAAIDPQSNHIWVCMNGSSDSAVVYEYTPDGKKVREYSFLADSRSHPSNILTSVDQVAVNGSSAHVFTAFGAFRFDMNRGAQTSEIPFQAAATCPAAVEFSDCKTPCSATSTTDDKDCKAELLASVNTSGRRIISTVCNSDSTSCLAQIKLCKESDGTQTTHNIDLSCSNGGGGDDEGGGDGGDCFPPLGCECCYDFFGCTCWLTPILIDVQGNGFNLTNVTGGISFNLIPGDPIERLAWTATGSDDAFLVLDRNGNGTIDDGSELFGNFTPQPPSSERNGFIALAEYDKPANGGNGDGAIDRRDSIFSSLRLWQDTNHNGYSEPSELLTLASVGLAQIDLDYRESKRTDQYGNQFRYRAKVRDRHGAQLGRWAWDVFFRHQ